MFFIYVYMYYICICNTSLLANHMFVVYNFVFLFPTLFPFSFYVFAFLFRSILLLLLLLVPFLRFPSFPPSRLFPGHLSLVRPVFRASFGPWMLAAQWRAVFGELACSAPQHSQKIEKKRGQPLYYYVPSAAGAAKTWKRFRSKGQNPPQLQFLLCFKYIYEAFH